MSDDTGPRGPRIVVRYGKRSGRSGQTLTLDGSSFILGRAADCDIEAQGDVVSRHHAGIRFENGRWFLYDFGSRNGVFVNKQQVERASIVPGDDILLGPKGPHLGIVSLSPKPGRHEVSTRKFKLKEVLEKAAPKKRPKKRRKKGSAPDPEFHPAPTWADIPPIPEDAADRYNPPPPDPEPEPQPEPQPAPQRPAAAPARRRRAPIGRIVAAVVVLALVGGGLAFGGLDLIRGLVSGISTSDPDDEPVGAIREAEVTPGEPFRVARVVARSWSRDRAGVVERTVTLPVRLPTGVTAEQRAAELRRAAGAPDAQPDDAARQRWQQEGIAETMLVDVTVTIGAEVWTGDEPPAATEGPSSESNDVPRSATDLVRPWELPASDARHVSERRWAIEHPHPLDAAHAALARLRAEPELLEANIDPAESRLWSQFFAVPIDDDPMAYARWRGDVEAFGRRLDQIESASVEAWARSGPDGASIRVAVWTFATDEAVADGTTLTEPAIDDMLATLTSVTRRALDDAVAAASAPLEEALVRALLDPYADPAEAAELVAELGALARSRGTVRLGRVDEGDAAHLVATDLRIGTRRIVRLRAQLWLGRKVVTIDAEGGEGLEAEVVELLKAR